MGKLSPAALLRAITARLSGNARLAAAIEAEAAAIRQAQIPVRAIADAAYLRGWNDRGALLAAPNPVAEVTAS